MQMKSGLMTGCKQNHCVPARTMPRNLVSIQCNDNVQSSSEFLFRVCAKQVDFIQSGTGAVIILDENIAISQVIASRSLISR